MIAANIMTSEVETLTRTCPLVDAMKLLWEKKRRQVPVVDDENKVLGVVSPRMILRSILPAYISQGFLKDVKFAPEPHKFIKNIEELANKCAGDFITNKDSLGRPNYAKVPPETSVMEIAAMFVNTEKHVESILVVDNMDRLIGIITPVDVFKRLCEFGKKKTADKA